MQIIIQKTRNVKLILIGDGQERQDLEKLSDYLNLRDFILFKGKLPNDEVLEYMVASDIFILPSLSEGFPVVIPEAMASGLPIITTNARGLPEIIQNNINGFIVETKNAKQIAERALYLLEDHKTRNRIAMTNKQDVNNYTWEKIINRLEGIYSNILSL
jgi:glycosyltransferase involved in cell wall biosynthesis